METDDKRSILTLLQPELLSDQELVEILEKRCPNINLKCNREKLIQMFRQTVLPYPQRKYRENRRGNVLTKRRLKDRLEDNKTGSSECKSPTKTSTNLKINKGGDRLKPPPEVTKIIRLTKEKESGKSSSGDSHITSHNKESAKSSSGDSQIRSHNKDTERRRSDRDGTSRNVVRLKRPQFASLNEESSKRHKTDL